MLLQNRKNPLPSIEKDSFTLVGVGELLWDVFESEKRLGGAPANVAFHAKQLGLEAQLLSKVGEDELGTAALPR